MKSIKHPQIIDTIAPLYKYNFRMLIDFVPIFSLLQSCITKTLKTHPFIGHAFAKVCLVLRRVEYTQTTINFGRADDMSITAQYCRATADLLDNKINSKAINIVIVSTISIQGLFVKRNQLFFFKLKYFATICFIQNRKNKPLHLYAARKNFTLKIF